MGKPQSKSQVTHNSDPQIKVINTQEYHCKILDNHEFLLYIILVAVVAQLLLSLYILLVKRERKRAIKFAKSVDNLANV